MLDSQVSHLPEQSALQRVQMLASVGLPLFVVPNASLLFENLISMEKTSLKY
jgi:hypothetical protein